MKNNRALQSNEKHLFNYLKTNHFLDFFFFFKKQAKTVYFIYLIYIVFGMDINNLD